MKLRPYQEECVQSILSELQGNQSTLCVMATGLGKTVVIGGVINEWGAGRILFAAHRDHLVHQGSKTIYNMTGLHVDTEMASEYAEDGVWGSRIVASSVQTMCRPKRHGRFDPSEFSLLVIDEAHHSTAKSYRQIMDYYRQNPNLKILGVTATPNRKDEQALGVIYDSVAYNYGIKEGIDDGWLVGIEQEFVTVEGLDYSGLKTIGGDFAPGELEDILTEEQTLHEMVVPIVEKTGNRPTIVFTATVVQAKLFSELLNRYRPGSSEIISGEDRSNRAQVLEDFRNGRLQYLCNCNVATEGFDAPTTGCIVMARPTKSQPLYCQMIGRGTRPLAGVVDGIEEVDDRKEAISQSDKPSVLVLDFAGNSGKHKLISTVDVLGGKHEQEVLDRAKKILAAKKGAVEQALKQAEDEIAQENLRAEKRRKINLKAKFSSRKVDPFTLWDITPTRCPGWHKGRKATANQMQVIRKAGIERDDIGFHEASQMIDAIIKRRGQDKCTFKQAKLLAKFGEDPDASFTEASALIDRIAKNGWRPL